MASSKAKALQILDGFAPVTSRGVNSVDFEWAVDRIVSISSPVAVRVLTRPPAVPPISSKLRCQRRHHETKMDAETDATVRITVAVAQDFQTPWYPPLSRNLLVIREALS
jgi:hypothetical protein